MSSLWYPIIVLKLTLCTLRKIFFSIISPCFLNSLISSFISSRLEPLPATTGYTVLCESACALDEVELIVIPPCYNVIFLDQIHWSDQLHTLEILAMELRHHRLHLSAVEHPHKDRLNHIVKMMSERNLIASQFFCVRVQIASSHSCAKVTWILVNICYRIKYLCLKYRKRDSKYFGIILDDLPVIFIVSRIHYQKY